MTGIFSDIQFIEFLAAIVTVISIVGAGVYGGIRKFYCDAKTKGANSANDVNKIKDLSDKVDKLTKDYDELTQDILTYRSKTEFRLDEMISNQSEMKIDIAVTKTNVDAMKENITSIKDTLNRVFPVK